MKQEKKTTDVLMVADFFIQRAAKDGDKLKHKKLQKLVYYAQARSLAIHGDKLFEDAIQARINGPVIPKLYNTFKIYGYGEVEPLNIFKDGKIGEKKEKLLEDVYSIYSPLSSEEISWLTHQEEPRKKARGKLQNFERSTAEITISDMEKFYVSKLLNK